MADFGSAVKNIWMKGMEAIGNTASSIASNTKYKVEEMTAGRRFLLISEARPMRSGRKGSIFLRNWRNSSLN